MNRPPEWQEIILQRAIAVENATGGQPWVWSQVQAHPSTLVRLVVAGLVEVVGKAGRARLYKVTADGRAEEVGAVTHIGKQRKTGEDTRMTMPLNSSQSANPYEEEVQRGVSNYGNVVRTPQPEVRARLIENPDDGAVLVLTLDRQSFRKLSREAKEHGRSLEGQIQDILEEATRRTTPEGGA